jgi:hypothetical protein
MAHYAYIDETNTVIAVTVGKDETELIEGLDTETYYAQGTPYTVKRTSYNNKIRYNYAGIGYTYDPIDDAFIAPKPYSSWILNLKKQWEPPVAYPTDGKFYGWNEETGEWYETEAI